MSQPAKAPEPSIDEILASIRRSIVPDEDAGKAAARKSSSRKPADTKARRADVEATRGSCDTVADQGPGDRELDGGYPPLKGEGRIAEGDPAWGDVDDTPGDPADVEAGLGGEKETRAGDAPAPDPPLLSPRTTAAVDTAFNSLAHTVLSQNPRTLEDLVRDMLKPMLKAWLDANLPDMVERLVRAEIERVSRRG